MYDNPDELKNSILAMGSRELQLWKVAVAGDENLLNRLFQFIFSDDHRLAWRSCWIIDTASEKLPGLLTDKLPQLITGLLETDDSSLKRHFARILCRYQIENEYLGVIIDRCFVLLSPSEPAAVRVFAMQLLYNISLRLPDLTGELISVLESLVEEGGSAGFVNRSHKLLKKLRSNRSQFV